MLKKIAKNFTILAFFVTFSFADEEFVVLQEPLPYSQNSVIEAFSYKCIHCYNHHKFNTLEKLKDIFPTLHFKLYPVSMMNGEFAKEMNELFAFARFKDEQNNKDASDRDGFSYKLSDAYFTSYFVNKQRKINSIDEFYDIGLKAMAIKKDEVLKFLQTPKAKEILKEFQKANDIAKTYGTPAFVVNGKYQINPNKINSMQDLENIVRKLSQM